jgi:hypothetical protein
VPTAFGGFHYDLTDLTKVLYFSVVKVHLPIAYHALCHFIKHTEPYSETVKTSLLYFYPLLLFHESQYHSSKVFVTPSVCLQESSPSLNFGVQQRE